MAELKLAPAEEEKSVRICTPTKVRLMVSYTCINTWGITVCKPNHHSRPQYIRRQKPNYLSGGPVPYRIGDFMGNISTSGRCIKHLENDMGNRVSDDKQRLLYIIHYCEVCVSNRKLNVFMK